MQPGCGRRCEQPEYHLTVAEGSGSPGGDSPCIEPWAVQRTAVEEVVRSGLGQTARGAENGVKEGERSRTGGV